MSEFVNLQQKFRHFFPKVCMTFEVKLIPDQNNNQIGICLTKVYGEAYDGDIIYILLFVRTKFGLAMYHNFFSMLQSTGDFNAHYTQKVLQSNIPKTPKLIYSD